MRPRGRLFFWSYAYYLSKYYEFIDTVLLLCKAKPASLLHVFHHALVVVMAWLWVDQAQTLQWGGLLTNTAVHVVMYWYYFETTLGNSPKWKKYITSFQIAQFSMRCAPHLGFVCKPASPDNCARSRRSKLLRAYRFAPGPYCPQTTA